MNDEKTQSPEILLDSRFFVQLELPGGTSWDGYFQEFQKIQRTQSPIEIVEVGPQQWGKAKYGYLTATQIPGRAKPEQLLLKRGLTNSTYLWDWFRAVEMGGWKQQVAEGSVTMYDQAGKEQVRFDFQGAWPLRYSSSDLDVQGTEFAIEELELSVAEFVRVKPPSA